VRLGQATFASPGMANGDSLDFTFARFVVLLPRSTHPCNLATFPWKYSSSFHLNIWDVSQLARLSCEAGSNINYSPDFIV
jgi:hypothetical protein